MDVNTDTNDAIQKAKKSIESEFDENENVKIVSRTDFEAEVFVKNLGMFVFTFCYEKLNESSEFIPMKVYEYQSHKMKEFKLPLTEYQENGLPSGELSFYEKYAKRFIETKNM